MKPITMIGLHIIAFTIGFIIGLETYKPRVIIKTEIQWVTPKDEDLQTMCHNIFGKEAQVIIDEKVDSAQSAAMRLQAYEDGYRAGRGR